MDNVLNLNIMSNPVNWIIVLLMVTIPLVGLKILHDRMKPAAE